MHLNNKILNILILISRQDYPTLTLLAVISFNLYGDKSGRKPMFRNERCFEHLDDIRSFSALCRETYRRGLADERMCRTSDTGATTFYQCRRGPKKEQEPRSSGAGERPRATCPPQVSSRIPTGLRNNCTRARASDRRHNLCATMSAGWAQKSIS